ncbi:ubiquinone biosynthesis protein COQ9 [Thraustotheca clavata]|uniref:non-specific serine/threonine protein kinase n=1 Tax=Thraustotheca clavata TaxID=74557 RepID=A0A1W0AAV3_9STRA|nr:ubiquinone biosynthesis protein COQ9 [Thraustotheca clavata]
MLMEFADGGDLHELIEKQASENRISEVHIIRLFVQVCLALKHLHDNNILHRDIKPQNIFLTSSGIVKLGDFGISKALKSGINVAQTQIGTPLYLSPEICQGEDYDFKSDIWGLGCVLHELLTLSPPFLARSWPCIVQKILNTSPSPMVDSHIYSKDMIKLSSILLSKSPKDRPSVDEILSMPYIQNSMYQLLSYVSWNHLPALNDYPIHDAKQTIVGITPNNPSTLIENQVRPKALSMNEEVARKQFLENQRAARLYKERMDHLQKGAPQHSEPINEPTMTQGTLLSPVPSQKEQIQYETLLAQERQRVHLERKALHDHSASIPSIDQMWRRVSKSHHRLFLRFSSSSASVEDPSVTILSNALRHVQSTGWSIESLGQGARDAGFPSIAHGMFPRGPIELVEFFMDDWQRQVQVKLAAEPLDENNDFVATDRLKRGVQIRLQLLAPYLHVWPQAMALGALPQNAPTTMRKLAQMADDIWFFAGDRSTDISWYTKRAVLTGIYTATELFMLTDTSENFEETWKFLDRRVEEAIALGDLPHNVGDIAGMMSIGLQSLLSTAAALAGPLSSQVVAQVANQVPNPLSSIPTMTASRPAAPVAPVAPETPVAPTTSTTPVEPKP